VDAPIGAYAAAALAAGATLVVVAAPVVVARSVPHYFGKDDLDPLELGNVDSMVLPS